MSYIPKNWNDLPIEDTPITADDLDHIENGIKEISNVTEYLNGILELNADTYVNISNQLISGMIIHIKFPTIVSTSNATLSLDNGTTKKSIKCSGVDVIGTDVSGKNLDLSYDGTYWQIGDVCSLDTRLTTVEEDINNSEAVIGNSTDTYSASSTYALGSLVIYNSLLYKCTTAITVAEAWNSAKWTQVSLTSLANEDNVYSTEEKVIGKWVDGKPLYRKVFSKSYTESSGLEETLVNNVSFGACLFGFTQGSGGSKISIPSDIKGLIYLRANNNLVIVIPNGAITIAYTVCLIYTKTTD